MTERKENPNETQWATEEEQPSCAGVTPARSYFTAALLLNVPLAAFFLLFSILSVQKKRAALQQHEEERWRRPGSTHARKREEAPLQRHLLLAKQDNHDQKKTKKKLAIRVVSARCFVSQADGEDEERTIIDLQQLRPRK